MKTTVPITVGIAFVVLACSVSQTVSSSVAQDNTGPPRCRVKDGQMWVENRGHAPAPADTLVLLPQPLGAKPLQLSSDGSYAARKDWFLSNDDIEFRERRYIKYTWLYSLRAASDPRQGVEVVRIGAYDGVPVYGDPTEAPVPQFLYVLLSPDCYFQTYRLPEVQRVPLDTLLR